MSPVSAHSGPTERSTPITVQARSGPLRARRAGWLGYGAVLLLALIARMVWAALVPVQPLSDSHAYETFARNLAAGLYYGWNGDAPSAFWPVGTSFLYSLVFRVFPVGLGYVPVVGLNLVMGLAVVALGMALTGRWFGRRPALIAGVLLALWPMHVQFTTIIASELPFTALCMGAVLLWPQERSRRGLGRVVLAAVVLAAAAYVRPTALLLPAVFAGAAWLRDFRFGRAVLHTAVAVLVMGVLIAPWSIRNTRAFGQFVLISTNGGSNMWMGNNPETTGHYQPLPEQPEHLNEAQFDKELGRRARAYIVGNPGAFLVRTAVKAVRLHERETIGIAWNQDALDRTMGPRALLAMKLSSQAYWMCTLAFAVGGVCVLLRRMKLRAIFHPGLLIWGYFTLVHAVIVIQDRYHFPATPVIAAFASVAIAAIWGLLPINRGRFVRVVAASQDPAGRGEAEPELAGVRE